MLVLIVEDELDLARLIIEYLEDEGFECDHAARACEADILIAQNHYDVIVLDVNLPDGNGFDVCKRFRSNGINVPTIMLTARSSLEDKSKGFASGVDDYLVKPFAMEELVMRLNALSQRGKRSDQIQVGRVLVHVSQRKAFVAEQEVSLSPDEWRLFLLLISRESETLSKETIMTHMWPDDSGTEDALKMLVFRLRKQLRMTLTSAALSDDHVDIQTVRGVGLRLVVL